MKTLQLFICVLMIIATQVQAETNTSSTRVSGGDSHRMANRFGLGLGFNNPHPSLAGLVASYNLSDIFRAELGYGEQKMTTGITFGSNGVTTREAKITSYGIGGKAMMPGWNFSPSVGLQVSHIQFSGDGEVEINGYNKSGTHVVSPVGFDWQSEGGFNLGAGYNVPLTGGSGTTYVNLGWYM